MFQTINVNKVVKHRRKCFFAKLIFFIISFALIWEISGRNFDFTLCVITAFVAYLAAHGALMLSLSNDFDRNIKKFSGE